MTNNVKILSESSVELVDFMGGDDRTALSAWVSFGNDNIDRLDDQKRVKGLINFLMREKHMTPFESSSFTFAIKTPIFVARELFRHRSASYNEWSGRYSEMLPEFYIPTSDRPLVQQGKAGAYSFVAGTPEQHDFVVEMQEASCHYAWNRYQDVLKAGVAKEVARNILPLNTYTRFYVTMNARNLTHFLGLRGSEQALYEIREVSGKMEKHLEDKMPFTYAAWKECNG